MSLKVMQISPQTMLAMAPAVIYVHDINVRATMKTNLASHLRRSGGLRRRSAVGDVQRQASVGWPESGTGVLLGCLCFQSLLVLCLLLHASSHVVQATQVH